MRRAEIIGLGLVLLSLSGCGGSPQLASATPPPELTTSTVGAASATPAPVATATDAPTATRIATATTTATPVPTATPAPTDVTDSAASGDAVARARSVEVLCDTENEEARQAYNTGVRLQTMGRIDAAIEMYREAIELDPNYCDAMDNLGLLLRSQGKYEEAIHWYQRSIEVAPTNLVAHVNLAAAYRLSEQFEEALVAYERVTTLDPQSPEGPLGTGICLLALKRYGEAITPLKRAEGLYRQQGDPYLSEAQFYLGYCYLMLGYIEDGRDYLELAYPSMPDSAALNYALGLCYVVPGYTDLDLARQYLGRAEELGWEIPADILAQIE